jgi:hypothetical protein
MSSRRASLAEIGLSAVASDRTLLVAAFCHCPETSRKTAGACTPAVSCVREVVPLALEPPLTVPKASRESSHYVKYEVRKRVTLAVNVKVRDDLSRISRMEDPLACPSAPCLRSARGELPPVEEVCGKFGTARFVEATGAEHRTGSAHAGGLSLMLPGQSRFLPRVAISVAIECY